jgi:Trk K+ transport system NAD-binding subunit
MVLPRGITTLEAGDEVLALVDEDAAIELAKLLGRPADNK